MRYKLSQLNKGFTLLEVIVYIAIFILVIGAFVTLAFSWLSSSTYEKGVIEFSDHVRFLNQKMTYGLRGGDSILSPSVGTSGSTLHIIHKEEEKNPTIFRLDGERITLKVGNQVELPITPASMIVENIKFSNSTLTGDTGNAIFVEGILSSASETSTATTSFEFTIFTR